MTIPTSVTLAIFSCGIIIGVVLIALVLLCCKLLFYKKIRQIQIKDVYATRTIPRGLSESQKSLEDFSNQREMNMPRATAAESSMITEDAIMTTLINVMACDETPATSRFEKLTAAEGGVAEWTEDQKTDCVRYISEPNSKKTREFYKDYSSENVKKTIVTKNHQLFNIRKNQDELPGLKKANNRQPFHGDDKLEGSQKCFKRLPTCSLYNCHLSPNVYATLKKTSSMPCFSDIINKVHPYVGNTNFPTNDKIINHLKDISFAKSLRNAETLENNAEKIQDSSLKNTVENADEAVCSNQEIVNKKKATETQKQPRSQEVLHDLWHLRAVFANRRESECSSTQQEEQMEQPLEHANSQLDFDSVDKHFKRLSYEIFLTKPKKEHSHEHFSNNKSSKIECDEFDLFRGSSIRRQRYKDSLIKRKNDLEKTEIDPLQHIANSSKIFPKIQNKYNEKKTTSNVELSKCGDISTSVGDNSSSKLERLKADSGYKSLENQRSLSFKQDERVHTFSPQISIIINEEEFEDKLDTGVFGKKKRSSSISQAFRPTLCSLKDKSVNHSFNEIDFLETKQIEIKNAAERRRIQYKFDRQSGRAREDTTESESKFSVFFKSQKSNSFISDFISTASSRFIKSHSRRALVKQTRDYSIDAKSDAIFKEFLRYDSALDSRNTLPPIMSNKKAIKRKHSNRFSTRALYLASQESSFKHREQKRTPREKKLHNGNTTVDSPSQENDTVTNVSSNDQKETPTTKLPNEATPSYQRNIPVIELTEEDETSEDNMVM